MKLLVLAQTPPPVHGQSLAVQSLLTKLSQDARFEFHHVNLALSRNAADIGRWRLRKVFAVLRACWQTLAARWKHGPMILYYIPAPQKRGALFRDWLIMAVCRPFFPKLILHWHAVGLGEWLQCTATAPERWITQTLLGRADLAIVLAAELADDARVLSPRQIAVVPGGLDAPARPVREPRASGSVCEILFLGLGCQEKGLFDTLEAVRLLEASHPGQFRLTAAGNFASTEAEKNFRAAAAPLAEAVAHLGFIDDQTKRHLLLKADVLCFPTYYPCEGQPLVLVEALAYDLPIVTTRWRAIPSMLPATHAWFVEPRQPDQVANALLLAREAGPARGAARAHYEQNFTLERHLAAMESALLSLSERS